MKPRSDSPAQTGSAISTFVEQPKTPQPGLVFALLPWRRPAIWAPVVDAVYAARDFLLHGADDLHAKEPMSMPIPEAPAKNPRPAAEASPSLARLEVAVRKAASAKAKAREAKAKLKKAKKSFRVARKAAKAARKDLEALQAAITSAEERAAAAAKRSRTTRRAPKDAGATATPRPLVRRKPARKTRHASSSAHSGAEVVYTEALAIPTDTVDESPSTLPS